MNRFFVCALVSLHAGPGFAQGAVDRALSAGSAVGGPEALMQESVIDDYVLPYETATPEEGGLSHVQFEDEVNEVREKDDAQGRALRSTEDGYAVRPDVDVDAQGPLFDDANWAHENADDVAGHYFSSETGTCETVALPVTEITDQFCSASPAEVSETCDLVRRIWVDRFDTYRCDKRAATYIEVCERTNEYSCHQASGQGGCLQQNVQFNGGTVTWNGDEATLHFPSPTPDQALPGTNGFVVHHQFSISLSDHFAPDEIRLINIEAGGASQLLSGDPASGDLEVVETIYAGQGNGIGAGSYCPPDARSGLLVPTRFDATCRGYAYWRLGFYQDYLDEGRLSETRTFYEWQMQWERRGDESDELVCGYVLHNPPIPACARFQTFGASANLSRTLLRWLNVPAPTLPVPGSPKVFADTDFTLRVVAEPGSQHASLTFKFIGTCCDSFVNTGVAVCQ